MTPPLSRSRDPEQPQKFKSKLQTAAIANRKQGWRLEMIGKRLTLRKTGKISAVKERVTRGPITCFSRKARAARLRRIAEVNWILTGRSNLLTLTYPDECAFHTMDERKVHRYLINREVVRQCGKLMACFWRVEWMPRKSGTNIGEILPHMHLLYLNSPGIDEESTRYVWMRTIGAIRHTQVDVLVIDEGDIAGFYVSKYCAKETDASILDYVPKRNKTGRHAGELRKELIPMHPLETTNRINDAILKYLQRRACETLWWFDPRFEEGFTILGDGALELIRDLHEMGIDVS